MMKTRYLFATLVLISLLPLIKGQRRGTVRLVRNGRTSPAYTSGRVQIYLSSWGHICDDTQFGSTEATVICHQMGYSGASSYSRSGLDRSTFGTVDSFPILIDDVDCFTSSYLVILQCSYSTRVDFNCIHGSYDASVICYTSRIWSSPYDGQIRLQQARYSSLGLVEVYCNGQWGTVCDDLFGSTDANTVCRQLGYTRAARYDHLTYRGSTTQPIWLNNVYCASFSYTCLRSCQRCPSTRISNCIHYEDVTVECEYALGSSTSTTTSTCNFGTSSSTVINIGAIVGGVIAGFICLIVLPIAIPLCICCVLGVGIGAACRSESRRPKTQVVTTATPPQPTTTVVTSSTSNQFQPTAYPAQPPGAYPEQYPYSPGVGRYPGYEEQKPFPAQAPPPYHNPAYPPPGPAYPPSGPAYPPP